VEGVVFEIKKIQKFKYFHQEKEEKTIMKPVSSHHVQNHQAI